MRCIQNIWKRGRNEKNKQKKQTEVKTCALCGREIFGDYEYVKTKRGTEMYYPVA